MHPPEELRASTRELKSGSSQLQTLRQSFPALRGSVSCCRFRSATDNPGKRARVLGVGSASSRAIRATAGYGVLYSLSSRGLAPSQRVAGRRLDAPAVPEAG